MPLRDNEVTSPSIITPAAEVSSKNTHGFSDCHFEELTTNPVKDHQFDSTVPNEDVKPNENPKRAVYFLNLNKLFEVLQSGPASNSSIFLTVFSMTGVGYFHLQ